MEQLHLVIDGMRCGHCVGTVKRSLDDVAGVSLDAVRIGAADLHFDPLKTNRTSIVAAVSDAGYAAHTSDAVWKVHE